MRFCKIALKLETNSSLQAILDQNPYKDKPKEHLYFSFLFSIPETEKIEKLSNKVMSDDVFAIIRNIIYVYCPNGYGKTIWNNTFFENQLKVLATTRNYNTLQQLLTMTTRRE